MKTFLTTVCRLELVYWKKKSKDKILFVWNFCSVFILLLTPGDSIAAFLSPVPSPSQPSVTCKCSTRDKISRNMYVKCFHDQREHNLGLEDWEGPSAHVRCHPRWRTFLQGGVSLTCFWTNRVFWFWSFSSVLLTTSSIYKQTEVVSPGEEGGFDKL